MSQGDGERITALVASVEMLTRKIEQQIDTSAGVQHQVVIHKTEGMGHWSTAAIVACFTTWLALILIAMEIHDLRAWKDIILGRLTHVEAVNQSAQTTK